MAEQNHDSVFQIKIYCVPLLDVMTPEMVHPAIYSCVVYYINLLRSWEKYAHAGSTGFKILNIGPDIQNVHTACKDAPLTSNTDIFDTFYDYIHTGV